MMFYYISNRVILAVIEDYESAFDAVYISNRFILHTIEFLRRKYIFSEYKHHKRIAIKYQKCKFIILFFETFKNKLLNY